MQENPANSASNLDLTNRLRAIFQAEGTRKDRKKELRTLAKELDRNGQLLNFLNRLSDEPGTGQRIAVAILEAISVRGHADFDPIIRKLLSERRIQRKKRFRLLSNIIEDLPDHEPRVRSWIASWLRNRKPSVGAKALAELVAEIPDRDDLWMLLREWEARDFIGCPICHEKQLRNQLSHHLWEVHQTWTEGRSLSTQRRKLARICRDSKSTENRQAIDAILMANLPRLSANDRLRFLMLNQSKGSFEPGTTIAWMNSQASDGSQKICANCHTVASAGLPENLPQVEISANQFRFLDYRINLDSTSPWGMYSIIWPNGFEETHSIPGILTNRGNRWVIVALTWISSLVLTLLLREVTLSYPALGAIPFLLSFFVTTLVRWSRKQVEYDDAMLIELAWTKVLPRVLIDRPVRIWLPLVHGLIEHAAVTPGVDLLPERIRKLVLQAEKPLSLDPELSPLIIPIIFYEAKLEGFLGEDSTDRILEIFDRIFERRLPLHLFRAFARNLPRIDANTNVALTLKFRLLRKLFDRGWSPRDIQILGRHFSEFGHFLGTEDELSLIQTHRLFIMSERRSWESTLGPARTVFEIATQSDKSQLLEHPDLLLVQSNESLSVDQVEPESIFILRKGIMYQDQLLIPGRSSITIQKAGWGADRSFKLVLNSKSIAFEVPPTQLRESLLGWMTWLQDHMISSMPRTKDFEVTLNWKQIARADEKICPRCLAFRN
jgi:hypothetical protein